MSQKENIIRTFNDFNKDKIQLLDQFYATDIVFQDPVTTVEGLDNLKKYYSHAYKNVESINFDFTNVFNDGNQYSTEWIMTVELKSKIFSEPLIVHGSSIMKFNQQGLVIYHRDYFDLGEMIYEHIPLLNLSIKGIKKLLHS